MTAAPGRIKKIHVIQGEYRVVDDSSVMLTTILGSCVAACLRDPVAGVGGMNHFLLPGASREDEARNAERYGVHLMELLVNGLIKGGARRERLEGKLFGGARMLEGLSDIGAKNAAFARGFLINEGIRIVAEDFGGTRGRRLEYFPVSGRARQSFLAGDALKIDQRQPVCPTPIADGALELF